MDTLRTLIILSNSWKQIINGSNAFQLLGKWANEMEDYGMKKIRKLDMYAIPFHWFDKCRTTIYEKSLRSRFQGKASNSLTGKKLPWTGGLQGPDIKLAMVPFRQQNNRNLQTLTESGKPKPYEQTQSSRWNTASRSGSFRKHNKQGLP